MDDDVLVAVGALLLVSKPERVAAAMEGESETCEKDGARVRET